MHLAGRGAADGSRGCSLALFDDSILGAEYAYVYLSFLMQYISYFVELIHF